MSRAAVEITYPYLRSRCSECGECLEWITATTKMQGRRYPLISTGGKTLQVRRLMYELSGRTIQPGRIVTPDCGNVFCVNPDHQVQLYESQKCLRAAARGAFSNPARRAAIAEAKRKEQKAKLTIELARQIRESDEPAPVWAARLGVNRSVISGIRRGERWKEYSANPFAGLLAMNDAERKAA